MKLNLTLFRTIIAKYFNLLISELFRHGSVFYLWVKLSIITRHVTETLETERTLVFMFSKILEAALVESMTTLQENWLFCGVVLVHKANWAFLTNSIIDTLMIILHWLLTDAALTVFTMIEVFLPSYSTKSTFITMKLLLWSIKVKQVANKANIVSK